MNELEYNTKQNTLLTLKYISSGEEQIAYKNTVPFVHIGYELLAQVASIKELINKAWFRNIWVEKDIKELENLVKLYKSISKKLSRNMPDVPEILQNSEWLNFMSQAKKALDVINEN